MKVANYQCNKCGCEDMFVKKSGNQSGLYCSSCGKWYKWLSKNELNVIENLDSESIENGRVTYNNNAIGYTISESHSSMPLNINENGNVYIENKSVYEISPHKNTIKDFLETNMALNVDKIVELNIDKIVEILLTSKSNIMYGLYVEDKEFLANEIVKTALEIDNGR